MLAHLKTPTPPSSNSCLCQISNISESLKIIVSFLIEYFLGHRHITSRSRRECWCLIQVNDIIHGNTSETRFYINVRYLQTMVWLTDNVLMMQLYVESWDNVSYVQKLSHLLIKVDQREFEQFCNCREIKWNISQLETVSQFHATQIAKCIFTNCTIFFYQNCKIISSKVKNVFAQITKCICLNCISVTARR